MRFIIVNIGAKKIPIFVTAKQIEIKMAATPASPIAICLMHCGSTNELLAPMNRQPIYSIFVNTLCDTLVLEYAIRNTPDTTRPSFFIYCTFENLFTSAVSLSEIALFSMESFSISLIDSKISAVLTVASLTPFAQSDTTLVIPSTDLLIL